MKKNLEKIFASASLVVAIILIMILLVTAFGGISTEEFNSNLVKGLIITLAVLYVLLAITSLVFIFINSDVVKEVMVRSQQKGSIRVSVGVIRKLVRQTCSKVEGVKCKKVTLITNEYGVRLKVNVKVVGKDVVDAESYIRTLLEDEFLGALGFRFHAIEIKVVALQPNYQINETELKEKAEDMIAQIKAEEASFAQVELSEEENQFGVAGDSEVSENAENENIDSEFSVTPADETSEQIEDDEDLADKEDNAEAKEENAEADETQKDMAEEKLDSVEKDEESEENKEKTEAE